MNPNVEELQTANRDLLTLLLQFNAVSELMSRASMPLDRNRVLENIAVGVRSELAFDRVAIWRYEPLSQSFVGEAAMGLPVQLVRSLRFPLRAGLPLVRAAVNEGRVMMHGAAQEGLLEAIYEGLGEPAGKGLVVPLLSRGKDRCWRVRRLAEGCAKAEAGPELAPSITIDDEHVQEACLACKVFPVEGFLWADNVRSGRPLHEDLLPLGLFLRQADLLLENAVLYEELSKVTIKDALTGVYNRAYFNHLVQVEAERSLRYSQSAAVVLIDVHALRRVNEVGGQAAGDRLLSVMGELIRGRLRRIDFVARYGGDEFAALLPHTDSAHALYVAQRLVQAISQHPFNLSFLEGPVRACAGVAVLPEHATDPDAVVALADFALHEAQTIGPDTVMRVGDPKPAEVR